MTRLLAAALFMFGSNVFAGENFTPVTLEEIKTVSQGLMQYYADCGFYPDEIEEIFVETPIPRCDNGGGSPPLSPTPENKQLVAKFIYKPLDFRNAVPEKWGEGFGDFELLVRAYYFTEE